MLFGPFQPTLIPASQRRVLRRALHFGCQVVREHDFVLIGDEAIDVSPDGMLVVTDARVLTGEELVVSFKLPHISGFIDAEATVARVVHGRRPGDRGRRCLGVEFQRIDPRARRALRAGLRHVPPPLPARERRVDYAATIHMLALA